MTHNLTSSGTVHLRALLDSALSSETGVRVEGLTLDQAQRLRSHLHSFRAKDRDRARKTFPESDPNHGRSAYDSIVTEISLYDPVPPTYSLHLIKSENFLSTFSAVDESTGEPIDLKEFL